MSETIILVDEQDNPVGFKEKIAAHENGGQLHRAFSIFIYNSKGEMLLQLRSRAKHHFGNLWSNACCSHPRKGEQLERAVHRKLSQEFGFDAEMKEVFSFVYKAKDKQSDLTEHEYDHVFVGQYDGIPTPNPEEIDDWKWVAVDELKKDLRAHPEKYTPWLKIAFDRVVKDSRSLGSAKPGSA